MVHSYSQITCVNCTRASVTCVNCTRASVVLPVSTAPGLVSCYQVCNQNPQLSTLRNAGHLIAAPNEHFHLPHLPPTPPHTHSTSSVTKTCQIMFSLFPQHTKCLLVLLAAASLPGHMRLPSPFGYMGKTKGGLRMKLLNHLSSVDTC